MSKTLDDAYKALNWMGTNMRPVRINDMDTGYKMELTVKAALDELKAREQKEQDDAVTDWISCQAWRQAADYICNYAKKGALLAVDGRLQTRNYDNAAGQKVYITEVVCESVSLLFGYGNRNITPDKDPRTAGYAGAQNAMSGYDYSSDPTLEISSDDLPF